MGISKSERGRLSKEDGELDSLTMLPISIPLKRNEIQNIEILVKIQIGTYQEAWVKLRVGVGVVLDPFC